MLILATCIGFSSCSEEDEPQIAKLNKSTLTLYAGSSEKLSYTGGSCSWSSDAPLIASVNNNGVVEANRVGTTTIRANNANCRVTVKPQYTMYTEPRMNWNASMATVKSLMSGYNLSESSSSRLTYDGKGNVFAYTYSFENGKLSGSAMGIYLSNADYIGNFIAERYVPVASDSNYVYFVSLDNKTMGAIGIESFVVVAYMPRESSKSRNNEISDIEKEKIAKLLTQISMK